MDGKNQTLLIISALIRVTALENILEALHLARNRQATINFARHKAAINHQLIGLAMFGRFGLEVGHHGESGDRPPCINFDC